MKGSVATRVQVDGKWLYITKANRAVLGAAPGPRKYDVRFRELDGRQVTKTFDTRRAAEKFLTATVQKVHDHTYVSLRPVLVGAALDEWIKTLKLRVQEGSLRDSTRRSYVAVVNNHIRPAFQTYRTDKLSGTVIDGWRRACAEKVAGGTMAPKFLNGIRGVLSAFVRWARHPERRYMINDPMSALEKLRLPRGKTRPHFEPHELAHLLALAAESPPDDTMIRAAALSGLRRGELGALRWPDIAWDDHQLHVRGSLDRRTVTLTKTAGSERVIDVPQELLDALAVHKLTHPPIGEQFVFREADGRALDWGEWHKKRLVKLLRKAGLREKGRGTGLHSIRHSYASMLSALGGDVGYVSRQLGHSTPAITQAIYVHSLKKAKGETMARLGAALVQSRGNRTEAAAAPGNSTEDGGSTPGVSA